MGDLLKKEAICLDAQFHSERDGIVMELFTEEFIGHFYDSSADMTADLHSNYKGSSPYHVNYCGYENCEPGYTFGPALRSSYLIHIIFRGKGSYYVGDRTYPVDAGQIFLIYPGDMTTYRADLEEPWSYGWIGFSGYGVEAMLSQCGFSHTSHVITIPNLDLAYACIQNLMKAHQITYANELHRTAELLQFFAMILESRPKDASTGHFYSRSTYAKAARAYIMSNYNKKLRIMDLAAHIGVDRGYLTKSFQEEYQMSPQEFLMQQRVIQAGKLLKETRKPISEIASEVGYPDALAFSRIFKRHTGFTPSAYRHADRREIDLDETSDKIISPALPRPSYAQTAMDYLGNNFQKKIRISEIADLMGVDRSYLTKNFQREFQMSPQEFLIKLRMDHACSLLKHTTEPLASIAAQVGYSDQQSFTKSFKKYTGRSPLEYRCHALSQEAEAPRKD